MKQISIAAAVLATGFAGIAGAEAPGGDPIKDGQTVHSVKASPSLVSGDPIKDGQTVRAASPTTALLTGDPIKDGQTFMAASGNDMGSSIPSRPNYSVSPEWEAFAYDRGGVRYVQINDTSGVLHVVVGVAGSTTLILPMGVDADHVTVGTITGATVAYNDGNIEIETVGGQWFVHPSTR